MPPQIKQANIDIEKAYPEAYRLARKFHNLYEEIAPKFGYETRGDTKAFEPASPNGRTMAYVCKEIVDEEVDQAKLETLEAIIKEVEGRIKYIDEFRSEGEKFGDPDYNFRSGWSGSESGECCDKCAMRDEHFTGRADALKVLVGCRNPFQLKEVCECHIPFRKVAAKAERKTLSDLLTKLRAEKELLENEK